MIRYKITHRYIGPLIACLCLGLSASSCVDDDAGCIEDKPGYVEGNDVWLSFTVKGEDPAPRTATSRASRADDNNVSDEKGHPTEAATEHENAIKGEMRLILFDNNRNLLKILDSSDMVTISHPANETDKAVYEIKAKINRAYFDYGGTQDKFGMSLMLVTNLNGFGTGHNFPADGSLFMKSTTWLSQQHYYFPYSPTVPDSDEGWYPDGQSRFIPMAGLRHYTVTKTELDKATNADDPYRLDETEALILQRAVAKIRVFDNINGANSDAKTEITAVSIKGFNRYGTFMPDFTHAGCEKWAEGTTMVEKATVKSDWFSSELSAPARKVGPAEGGEYTDNEGHTFTTAFVAYIPEADLTTAIPQLIITTKSEIDKTEANPDGIRPWTFSLKEIIKETGIDITRNHIYEFTVTRSLNVTTQLEVSVMACPWSSGTVDVPEFN